MSHINIVIDHDFPVVGVPGRGGVRTVLDGLVALKGWKSHHFFTSDDAERLLTF